MEFLLLIFAKTLSKVYQRMLSVVQPLNYTLFKDKFSVSQQDSASKPIEPKLSGKIMFQTSSELLISLLEVQF